jgi:hypothetical protein
MSPDQAAKYLFELLTSVEDGVVTVSVARSPLIPACSIKIQKQYAGVWRPDAPVHVVSDDFASALDKASEE